MTRVVPGLAEVMDKMPLRAEVWMWGIILGLICFFMATRRWWLVVLGPLASIFVFAMTGFADNKIAPFIESESPGHAVTTLPAVAMPLLGSGVGLYFRDRQRRRLEEMKFDQ